MSEDSWIFAGFGFAILCIFVVFGVSCHQYNSMKNEREKDKFILIEKNSLGCGKYKYNDSIVWKCPKELGLSSIESRYCTGGKHNTCRTEQEPVL